MKSPKIIKLKNKYVYLSLAVLILMHSFMVYRTQSRHTARIKCDLTQVRVHDLKHTFGRRLRAAGVPNETRKVLLGHRNGDITTHYSAPELEELIEAANRVCEQKSGKIPALTILKRKKA